MKFPLPPNTFPPVDLSEQDAKTIEALADYFVQDTMERYQDHRVADRGVVDTNRWKMIKQREDVRVYRERSSATAAAAAVAQATGSSSVVDPAGNAEVGGGSQAMPLLLTFGTIQGNLDDVMYGAMNPTVDGMKLKSAYVEDGFVDWAVLATLIKPTPQEPLRELSIKWTVKGHPLLIGAVMRIRDTLYIESIGITHNKNGERIGYHLQHSIELPAARELLELNIVRAKISFCHLFRQKKEDVVEVYVRGLISIMGDAPASFAALTSADVSVSVWKNVHCAKMKKLSWLLRTKSGAVTVRERQSTSAACCGACSRPLPSALSVMSSKSKTCRVCLERVCSRCYLTERVHSTSAYSDKVIRHKTVFCVNCVKAASRTSAQDVAIPEMVEAERHLTKLPRRSTFDGDMTYSSSSSHSNSFSSFGGRSHRSA